MKPTPIEFFRHVKHVTQSLDACEAIVRRLLGKVILNEESRTFLDFFSQQDEYNFVIISVTQTNIEISQNIFS